MGNTHSFYPCDGQRIRCYLVLWTNFPVFNDGGIGRFRISGDYDDWLRPQPTQQTTTKLLGAMVCKDLGYFLAF